RRCAGFAQKTKPRRFIAEISLADDLQCHGALQIRVERLVSDTHRTATQFDRFAIFTRHQLIVLKSLHRLLQYRLDRILGSRSPAGFSPPSKAFAKHAYRAEFHRSRELIATAWARASEFRFHGSYRPSDAIRASRSARISSSISAGSNTARPISSRDS